MAISRRRQIDAAILRDRSTAQGAPQRIGPIAVADEMDLSEIGYRALISVNSPMKQRTLACRLPVGPQRERIHPEITVARPCDLDRTLVRAFRLIGVLERRLELRCPRRHIPDPLENHDDFLD